MTDSEVAISAGTAGDTEIDLYADVVENELETEANEHYGAHVDPTGQDPDLYDDVIRTQGSATDFTDITNTVDHSHGKHDHLAEVVSNINIQSNAYNGKRVSLYIGQLTWWTTDADLAGAVQELGIKDLLEVKFHENRVNGQSKGFAVVTVGSEVSSRLIQDKIPKREIHGQNPMVLPCNKQSLNFFEGSTRKDVPMDQMTPMGVPPLRPMMRPSIGLPLPMPRAGPMDQAYRFQPQGPVLLPGGPGGMARGPMPITMGPRGPMPGGPMVLSRMPGPAPAGVHPPQQVVVMQRPGVPPGTNGSLSIHPVLQPGNPGVPGSSNSMGVMPGQNPGGYYQTQSAQGPPPHGVPMPQQGHPDQYYRSLDARHDPNAVAQISESEFKEIMERNKNVSSSAISRAVEDASDGNFGTAIETLVTAISLIKQSKIANDSRCKILISSLQDTLKGIEEKSYGARGRHRSRSGSPRESSRKKHRHRSRTPRSPRDRSEYRRGEDYDNKYSREHRRR